MVVPTDAEHQAVFAAGHEFNPAAVHLCDLHFFSVFSFPCHARKVS
jgi:hypothetical protein